MSYWLNTSRTPDLASRDPIVSGAFTSATVLPSRLLIASRFPALCLFKIPVLATGAAAIKVDPKDGPTRLSHEGKRIAFVRHDREKQTDTLILANADGSDQQTLITRKWPERFAWDWSHRA
ncbi:MAG TPA: hypothetical protein VEW46_03715 [Pyrinomonadaceae bacterium]|nr:hypothetical protein [Pyrinomonadaceae bacterium]